MENKKVNNIKKLTDTSIENVSGGLSPYWDKFLLKFGCGNLILGTLGGIGYSIASYVFSHKSCSAIQNGDTITAEQYANLAKGFTTSAALSSGQVALGLGTLAIRYTCNKDSHPQASQTSSKK